MERVIKFKVWQKSRKRMLWQEGSNIFRTGANTFEIAVWVIEVTGQREPPPYDDFIYLQYTGLKDKNGKEGYFDCDIWEIKVFTYRFKTFGGGYYSKKCDLRFILKQDLLKVEYKLINRPEGLDFISLSTIFNLTSESGERIYVDDDRKKLEIIGNKFENPELFNKKQ